LPALKRVLIVLFRDSFNNCLNCPCQTFDFIKYFSFLVREIEKRSQGTRSGPYGKVPLVRYEDFFQEAKIKYHWFLRLIFASRKKEDFRQ